ncbi:MULTISPECIES: LysE family translocator [unclassified Ruegeria]|uniref:LysE family translocator n=1 Tax=unclassified Ruegeria TaxID=2625375 RepID=UPI001ADA81B9|nr:MULTISPECIES: LysE family translocator [unclassified Ruegeria]MBO9413711.1 LysE family translocator [Ruegeria sp. R8_1]MBO9417682.1 LysE family translocator [Ruegeria sp. R8_2]
MITSGFVAIWLAWLMAGGSPGPATMGIAGTAMNEGRRAGLVFALGICAGSAAWGVAAALGLSAVMLANIWVFEVIRYFGVAYLGWLAFKALRRAMNSDEAALGQPVTGSLPVIFAKGAGIHLTNPKAILSWGSIYAIVAPSDASLPMLLGYFALLYGGSVLIFVSYAFLFSSDRMVCTYRRARRWFDFAFAGFFGLASYKILTVRFS